MILQEPHFSSKNIQADTERMENDILLKWNQKRVGAAILTSDKIGFKSKTNRRQKGHYFMIKASIHQKDITIVNTYASYIRAPKYTKEALTDLKGEIDKL